MFLLFSSLLPFFLDAEKSGQAEEYENQNPEYTFHDLPEAHRHEEHFGKKAEKPHEVICNKQDADGQLIHIFLQETTFVKHYRNHYRGCQKYPRHNKQRPVHDIIIPEASHRKPRQKAP